MYLSQFRYISSWLCISNSLRRIRITLTSAAAITAATMNAPAIAGAQIYGAEAWIIRNFQVSYNMLSPSSAISGGTVRYQWTVNPNEMCNQGVFIGGPRDSYKLGETVNYNQSGRFFILPDKIPGTVYGGHISTPVNINAYFVSGEISAADGTYIAVGSSGAQKGPGYVTGDPSVCTSGQTGLDKRLIYRVDVPQGILPAGTHSITLNAPTLYFMYIGNQPQNVVGGGALHASTPFMPSTSGRILLKGEIIVNNYCRLETASANINHGTLPANIADGNFASTNFRVMCNNPVTTKLTASGLSSNNELNLGTGLKSTISAKVNGQDVDFAQPAKDYTLGGTGSNIISVDSTLHLKNGETLKSGTYSNSFVLHMTYQ